MQPDRPADYEMFVGSPEVSTTIESVPGATLETARRLAELLEKRSSESFPVVDIEAVRVTMDALEQADRFGDDPDAGVPSEWT